MCEITEELRRNIAHVLCREGIIDAIDELPSPTTILSGEAEQVTNYLFLLSSGDAIVAKVPNVESQIDELLQSFGNDFASCYKAMDPISYQKGDQALVFYDGKWIRNTFANMELLKPGADLGPPFTFKSGLAGFSRVYVYALSEQANTATRIYIVKFDLPSRIEMEWDAIQAAQHTGKHAVRAAVADCRQRATPWRYCYFRIRNESYLRCGQRFG